MKKGKAMPGRVEPVVMPKSFLCRIGLHKTRTRKIFVPNIHADIVTEFDFSAYCIKCGKVTEPFRKVWNGDEYVDA